MSKKNVHIVYHKDRWAVKRAGNQRSSSLHGTKSDSEKVGRDIARRDGVELVIHGKNGKIQDKDSYGNDPRPPKDTKH